MMYRRASRLLRDGSVLALAFVLCVPTATAQDGAARSILKAMADFMAGASSLQMSVETDIEVITPDLQKIQFASSGQAALVRPDKLRASRLGGYADIEMVFDGRTLTLHDRHARAYAQVEAVATIDQLIDRLRDEHGVEAPAADLLLTGVYKALTEGVVDAKHIGRGVIDDVECEHLAFRNEDTDWQIWIAVGPRPLPHKYVITSKTVNSAPQFTLRLRDWKVDAAMPAGAFTFLPPADARKLAMKDMPHNDEVPAATGARR